MGGSIPALLPIAGLVIIIVSGGWIQNVEAKDISEFKDEHYFHKREVAYNYGGGASPYSGPSTPYPGGPPPAYPVPYYQYPVYFPPPQPHYSFPPPYGPCQNCPRYNKSSSTPPPAPPPPKTDCTSNDPPPTQGCFCTRQFNPTRCTIQNCIAGDLPGSPSGYNCYCNANFSPNYCASPEGGAADCSNTQWPPCSCNPQFQVPSDKCQLKKCPANDPPSGTYTCICPSESNSPPDCVTTDPSTMGNSGTNSLNLAQVSGLEGNGLVLEDLLGTSGLPLDDLSGSNPLALVDISSLLNGNQNLGTAILGDDLAGSLLTADVASDSNQPLGRLLGSLNL